MTKFEIVFSIFVLIAVWYVFPIWLKLMGMLYDVIMLDPIYTIPACGFGALLGIVTYWYQFHYLPTKKKGAP
jgi:hypothetical protein